ncbi:D-proline reductase (dithiol) proprotein PrdA [Clostridium botulinum]|uniref:Glycine/sarcosine/betaine reductase, component B, subunits alpha and beta n=1 Tax=Clostridium botulinum (strain Langeland / NCTC 10281 / Type F) TaxID=441772 RepID=A7GJH2_CLOBL|nr:D-proline reductase (dithiol) proprotein PrdA [Clostridium botulinum]ABS42351.1 glycine/sarcosine/betaine reductase, component B, subunits alpha and beta [Clostridium botulinum F str. Langeland]ADG01288.1 glycine/sarcosine/betaine reductase, component B, subunits alpha and beta [Clostridium botulinum F str. 230613]KKM43921.1 proline reductase [Clostridium botulinum]MBY6794224.1 D-proline reductase (dithiol) proprotein PrdA [Clostridium botulinum]MBY6939251.1 D-proline reductase (dithiol) pr
MSITNETVNQHKKDPAIVCCRTTEGTIIGPGELEDPNILPDLEDSGLVEIPSNVLKIGQVIGAKLLKDIDGLTPLTADLLEGIVEEVKEGNNKVQNGGDKVENISANKVTQCSGGIVRLTVDQMNGVNLEFPVGAFNGGNISSSEGITEKIEDEIVSTLKKREFAVKKVELGKETYFKDGVLTIREELCKEALKADPLVKKLEMDIITPDNRHVYSNTIMDVIPVATKVEGQLGEGITHILNGMVFILTGVDEAGVQVHEFGSCEGYLDEKIIYGKPGCPDPDDIIVRVHAIIQDKTGMERRGPYAAHKACDVIIQEIRKVLKETPAGEAEKEEIFDQVKRHGRPRVLLVKEIMGQGAMHDNVMLPTEPAGVHGGRQNVDLGNVPVVLSVNEVRDGGIHALTCIGPASKEDTRHYFREPVLEALAADEELDIVGVAFIGSPQVNDEKAFVSKRLGAMTDTMKLDGAIVTTEGFGNNHIDFSYNIEEIGKRGINVVGVTYAAYQGQLVVGNKYMDAMIEVNKDKGGFESELLGENTITADDAKRAVLMLKNKIAGVEIEPADRKWSQEVIDENQKITDGVMK